MHFLKTPLFQKTEPNSPSILGISQRLKLITHVCIYTRCLELKTWIQLTISNLKWVEVEPMFLVVKHVYKHEDVYTNTFFRVSLVQFFETGLFEKVGISKSVV